MTYDDYPYEMLSYPHTDATIRHAEHLLTTVRIPNIEQSPCEESCRTNTECKLAVWTVEEASVEGESADAYECATGARRTQCVQQLKVAAVSMESVDVSLSDTHLQSTSFVKPACHDACGDCTAWIHDGRCVDAPDTASDDLDCRVCDTTRSASATCQVDLAVPNGDSSQCSSIMARGAACEPTCDDGYELHGRFECKSDGTVGVHPTCLPRSCDASKPPEHGSAGTCTSRLGHGEVCVPTCDRGYSVDGATKCKKGQLKSIARCVPSDCDVNLDDMPNATAGTCGGTLAHGESCQPKCNRGFESSGPTTCNKGRLRATTCVAGACDIREVETPHSTDPGGCRSDELASGESCAPVCDAGYALTQAMKCEAGRLTRAICEPLSGVASASGDADVAGRASRRTTKACDASAPPENGTVGDCTARLPYGQSCQPICNDGFASSGPTTCESGELIQTKCTPRVCSVTAPRNGQLGACPAVLKHGDACLPSCASGFEVDGENRCTNGQIEAPARCVPAKCALSAATAPTHGTLGDCPESLKSGESCSPRCEDGYEPVGADTKLTCDHGALSAFACKPKHCTVKTNHTLYDATDCPPTLQHGESCSPVCDRGYELKRPISCNLGEITEGVCKSMVCQVQPIPNGTVECPGVLYHGQSCDVSCDDGFEREGGPIRCDVGVLTNPVCRRKKCAPLCETDAPEHGALGCELGRRLEHGETITPVCDAGYSLSAPIRCVDGVLSAAECLPDACDVSSVEVPNGTVATTTPIIQHGEAIDVECDFGFERTGDDARCDAGRVVLPTCRPKRCVALSEEIHAPAHGALGCPTMSGRVLEHGDVVRPACDAGYSLSAPIRCVNGALSAAECLPDACDVADADVAHGIVSCEDDSSWIDHGRTCDVECEAGRELVGDLTCDAGKWTHPICRRKTCMRIDGDTYAIENGTNGSCENMTLRHGEICSPSCDVGYTLTRPVSCVDGTLSSATCELKYCTVDDDETYATLGDCDASMPHGASCQPTCDRGYSLESPLRCWDGRLIQGECVPSACVMTLPPNSNPGACNTDTIDHGASCKPSCEPGFTLQGETTCSHGALQMAACVPSSCDLSTTPISCHGTTGDCPDTLQHGQSCQPACERGYTPTNALVCDRGIFVRPVDCQPDACDASTPPNHATAGDCTSHLPSGKHCTPQCDEGYVLTKNTSCKLGVLDASKCVPMACDVMSPPSDGSMGTCTSTLAHGAKCKFECDVGYRLEGDTSCSFGNLTEGRCVPSSCDVISEPENGTMGNCARTLAHGETCLPTCNVGFSRKGVTYCNHGVASIAVCEPNSRGFVLSKYTM